MRGREELPAARRRRFDLLCVWAELARAGSLTRGGPSRRGEERCERIYWLAIRFEYLLSDLGRPAEPPFETWSDLEACRDPQNEAQRGSSAFVKAATSFQSAFADSPAKSACSVPSEYVKVLPS